MEIFLVRGTSANSISVNSGEAKKMCRIKKVVSGWTVQEGAKVGELTVLTQFRNGQEVKRVGALIFLAF